MTLTLDQLEELYRDTPEVEMPCPWCHHSIAGRGDYIHMHLDACMQIEGKRMDKKMKVLHVLDWTLSGVCGGWCTMGLIIAIQLHQMSLIPINASAIGLLVGARIVMWRTGVRKEKQMSAMDERLAKQRNELLGKIRPVGA